MNFEDMLNSQEFLDAYNKKYPKIFRNIDFPRFTWDQCFAILDEDIKQSNPHGQKYLINGWRSYNAVRIPEIKNIIDILSKNFKKFANPDGTIADPAMIYGSWATNEGSSGPIHQDPENVIFIQVGGRSRWTVYNPDDSICLSEELDENDMIYCPGSTKHVVSSLTPRYSLSMGFGEKIN